jgi:hypothetical protein
MARPKLPELASVRKGDPKLFVKSILKPLRDHASTMQPGNEKGSSCGKRLFYPFKIHSRWPTHLKRLSFFIGGVA